MYGRALARPQPALRKRRRCRSQTNSSAEGIRHKLADLSELMRAGGLRLEDAAELGRANALLPSTQIAVSSASLPELASSLQGALYRVDRPMVYVLAHLIPPRLADDDLSPAATDLRAMLGRVRSEFQDRRGLAHAEQARELRNRAESLKREAGAKEPPAPWKGPNDIP